MCRVCKDTGGVLDERAYGVMFKPCYCEVAQRKQANAQTELQQLLDGIRTFRQARKGRPA
jgi:hypothetical protein